MSTESAQQVTRETPPVLLPRREVERRVGLSRSTIYDRIAKGTFPRQVSDLDSATVWWVEEEITAWCVARIKNRSMGRRMGSANDDDN